MLLNTEQLFNLEQAFLEEINNKSTQILSKLNRRGQLETFLELADLMDLLPKKDSLTNKDGKIVVTGKSEVSETVLLAIAKNLGFDKERFELCLDYEKAEKFNYKKMQYSFNYSLIMVGPMGHSGPQKGKYGSIISSLEQEEGYPPVIRIGSNDLKITKSSFKTALIYCLEQNLINHD